MNSCVIELVTQTVTVPRHVDY